MSRSPILGHNPARTRSVKRKRTGTTRWIIHILTPGPPPTDQTGAASPAWCPFPSPWRWVAGPFQPALDNQAIQKDDEDRKMIIPQAHYPPTEREYELLGNEGAWKVKAIYRPSEFLGSNPIPRICFEKRVKLSNWVSHTHSSKSMIGSLFLKLHEIFIPWTFVRIHTIHWNPLPFPRVESSWAWHFFNHRFMESWYYPGFDVFTICAKMVYAHVRFPLCWLSADMMWCIVWVMLYALCQYAWRGSPFCE